MKNRHNKIGIKKLVIFTFIICASIKLYSQNRIDSIKFKTNNAIALFPRDYSNNNGLTLTHWINEHQNSNGLHIEIVGGGLATMFTPGYMFIIPDTFNLNNLNDSLNLWITSKINGLSISPFGLLCNSYFKGLSINGFGFYIPRLKGVGISVSESQSLKAQGFIFALGFSRVGLMQGLEIAGFNGCSILNGVQLGVFNYCNKGKGLQISLFNSAEDFKGIQIGFLNKIGKLYLPFINMKFKKK